MTDGKMSKRPRIGGINQYATLGGIKRPDAQMSNSLEGQKSNSSDVETSSSPEVQQSNSAEVRASGSLNVETSKMSNATKSNHPDWQKQTIYLPPDLIVNLKVQAAIERREISEIVAQILRNQASKEQPNENSHCGRSTFRLCSSFLLCVLNTLHRPPEKSLLYLIVRKLLKGHLSDTSR